MKQIPVMAAEEIAKRYGYDQVVIIARKVSNPGDDHVGGEHVTTYGIDRANCEVAGRIGMFIKHRIMKWPEPEKT